MSAEARQEVPDPGENRQNAASHLSEVDSDFAANLADSWSYTTGPHNDARIPYATSVLYFNHHGSAAELQSANDSEGRAVALSETRNTINNRQGLHVGVLAWLDGAEGQPAPLKFDGPVPLDDAFAGDQPPITGLYPRVTFPTEGTYRYAPYIILDPDTFGTRYESVTVEIPEKTHSLANLCLPNDCPCPDAVKKALQHFIDADPDKGIADPIPQGVYTINIEVESNPLLVVRTDGGRPAYSTMIYSGDSKPELPIASLYSKKLNFFSVTDVFGAGAHEAPARNPLKDRQNDWAGEKYIERPLMYGNEANQLMAYPEVRLTFDGADEKAELTYESTRRHESVAETNENPHFGLLEVQVGSVARATNIAIDFEAKYIARPAQEQFLTRSADEFRLDKLLYTPREVNTGRTVLSSPRKADSLPTVKDYEWDGHRWSFRICLTNDIN